MKASKQFDLGTELFETRQNSLQPRWKSHEELIIWFLIDLLRLFPSRKKYKLNVLQYLYF